MNSATLKELLDIAYRSWPGELRAAAHGYFSDSDLVAAVIQEAYIAVVEAAAVCEDPQRALGYWQQAIRTRSINRLRKLGRVINLDEPALEHASAAMTGTVPSPEEDYINRETDERRRLALQSAVSKLLPKKRQAVELHSLLEMTYEQIGERLGIDPSTAQRRFQSACEQLPAILRADQPDLWPAPESSPWRGGDAGGRRRRTYSRGER